MSATPPFPFPVLRIRTVVTRQDFLQAADLSSSQFGLRTLVSNAVYWPEVWSELRDGDAIGVPLQRRFRDVLGVNGRISGAIDLTFKTPALRA